MFLSVLPEIHQVLVAQQQQGGEAAGAGMVSLFLNLLIIAAVLAGWWKVFSKAGQPGWAVLIPIYNVIVLLRIVGRPAWWLLLMLVPVVNLVVAFLVYRDLAKVFGRGTGFAIGLLLLNPVFMLILGFSGDEYSRPAMAAA